MSVLLPREIVVLHCYLWTCSPALSYSPGTTTHQFESTAGAWRAAYVQQLVEIFCAPYRHDQQFLARPYLVSVAR